MVIKIRSCSNKINCYYTSLNSLIFYKLFVATKTFDFVVRINNMYFICVTSHGGPCLNAKVQIKAKLGVWNENWDRLIGNRKWSISFDSSIVVIRVSCSPSQGFIKCSKCQNNDYIFSTKWQYKLDFPGYIRVHCYISF